MSIRLILLIICISCNKIPDSIGLDNEIIIIASDKDREYVKIYLDEKFNNYYTKTPITEYHYNLHYISESNFSSYKNYKNIILISLTNPIDSTIDVLYNKFSQEYESRKIYALYDLYSFNQIIIPIKGLDSIEFDVIIEDYFEWIRGQIDINIQKNIISQIKMNNNNVKIESIFKDMFSLDLYVDENYQIIKHFDDFLWIGRGYPYRWIISSKHVCHECDYWDILIEAINKNTKGIHISEFYRNNIQNNEYNILTGLYEHSDSDTGGPFFTYVIDNNMNNEVILVSGFVNNPGKDKYLLLKQLDIIIKNIKGNYYEL